MSTSKPHSLLDEVAAELEYLMSAAERPGTISHGDAADAEARLLAHVRGLEEQYESRERELFGTGKALANADRVTEELTKRIAELEEQLETEKHGWASLDEERVGEIGRLNEQLETAQREYAASCEISKWALETKRCDEPSPGGAMLCDREPGHEGIHVNWQGTEWNNSQPVDARTTAARAEWERLLAADSIPASRQEG